MATQAPLAVCWSCLCACRGSLVIERSQEILQAERSLFANLTFARPGDRLAGGTEQPLHLIDLGAHRTSNLAAGPPPLQPSASPRINGVNGERRALRLRLSRTPIDGYPEPLQARDRSSSAVEQFGGLYVSALRHAALKCTLS